MALARRVAALFRVCRAAMRGVVPGRSAVQGSAPGHDNLQGASTAAHCSTRAKLAHQDGCDPRRTRRRHDFVSAAFSFTSSVTRNPQYRLLAFALTVLRQVAIVGCKLSDVHSRIGRVSAQLYCALMPASPMTFPHLAISVRNRAAHSSGVLATDS